MKIDPKDLECCHGCRKPTHIDLLDAKPASLAGRHATPEELAAAADRGEDFDRLECMDCYGPCWEPANSASMKFATVWQRVRFWCRNAGELVLALGD